MRKKKSIPIFSIITTIVLILVALKITTLVVKENITVTTTPNELINSEENICFGLNYHRIRKPTFLNKFIEKMTNDQEFSVYSVYSDEFENQILQLKEAGAYFATLDDVIRFKENGEFPEKCVWISFDDVDKSVYEIAYPILKKYDIPFTLFIIAGQVGSNNFSNLQLSTWDELREMKNSGLASFGSHTFDMHYYENETDAAEFLSPENYKEFAEDIKLSKEIIDKELGIDIKTLAYPFGNASDDIIKIVESSGFTNAYLLNNSYMDHYSDNFAQGRYLIDKITFDNIILPSLTSPEERE